MRTRLVGCAVSSVLALLCSPASVAMAHVGVSGPGFAGQNAVLTFSVGHGCEGADTVGVEIAIPEEITSLRAVPSPFGAVELEVDDAELVTSVVWTTDDARDSDQMYYQMQVRVRLPDAPFTTLLFPATQHCRAADGTESTVEWAATPEEIAEAEMGAEPEPAPALTILPVRAPGWNKIETSVAIEDLSVFDDAEIVWVGDAAYSSNPTTKELIASEDGVDELTEIEAGAAIWVTY
jgi:uncharacterized protein YcnI